MTSARLPLIAIPPTADGHFRLLCYAAILHVLHYVRANLRAGERGDGGLPRFAFLDGYAAELATVLPVDAGQAEALELWREAIAAWEHRAPARLPLRALARCAELAYPDLVALALIGLVEADIRFGALFAELQDPLPSRRPCLGLLAALLTGRPIGASGLAWDACRRLRQAGLIVNENEAAPCAEWIPRIPSPLWEALRGLPPDGIGPGVRLSPRRAFPPLKSLLLAAGVRAKVLQLPRLLAGDHLDAIVVRGPAGSGRRTILGSVARSLRRDLLLIDRRDDAPPEPDDAWRLIGPVCSLGNALPVVALDAAPGETEVVPRLRGYDGPLGIVMRNEGGVTGPAIRRALTLTLPRPSLAERDLFWQRCLGDRVDRPTVSRHFLLPIATIHKAAAAARAHALVDQRLSVSAADVRAACRSLNQQALETLAQRLDDGGTFDDLVVSSLTADDLADLLARCRHRERLAAVAAAGGSGTSGVRALFNGPSGTGKSLAARILAATLAKDLYRVDLAAVVNKYIGETEKNLSRLFARAEELDVLILIDEGDALMGSRTDIKSANDRYANLETNYLLQRLETYDGVVIVTTNASNRIDPAFQRRFDVLIEFTPPDTDERRAIWQRHLPAAHGVDEQTLERVAQACALTGGQIRNAALHAALLAVDDGRDCWITAHDLESAIRREYRKTGAVCPLQPSRPGRRQDAALRRFLADLDA